MADVSLEIEIRGVSYLDLTFLKHRYKNFKFYVISNLIADSIIGRAAITSLFLRFVLFLKVCVLENIFVLIFKKLSLF